MEEPSCWLFVCYNFCFFLFIPPSIQRNIAGVKFGNGVNPLVRLRLAESQLHTMIVELRGVVDDRHTSHPDSLIPEDGA